MKLTLVSRHSCRCSSTLDLGNTLEHSKGHSKKMPLTDTGAWSSWKDGCSGGNVLLADAFRRWEMKRHGVSSVRP